MKNPLNGIFLFFNFHLRKVKKKLESIMILFTEKVRKSSFFFWFFSCDHFNDSLSKNPSKISHEKGEETRDTIPNDGLEIGLTTSNK